jgi:hypothetical protein
MAVEPRGSDSPSPLGDILKKIVRKGAAQKKKLAGRRLAQKALDEMLGPRAQHAAVASVKTGVVTIEADSSALFQELEGFQKEKLIQTFRGAGLQVREVRVRLAQK